MRGPDLARYAFGGLRGHGLRTGFSLTGVAIGVASVILLTALGEGARLYVADEFSSLGTNLLIVIPGKTETFGGAPMVSTAPNDLTVDDAVALARRVRQVHRAAPVAMGGARIRRGERARDITVFGTTHPMREIRSLTMATGRYLPAATTDAPVCVLGAKIARELFAAENPLGEMVRLGEFRFRVIGVLAERGTSVGFDLDEVVHVPVETALRLFNRTSLFRVLLEVRNPHEMAAAEQAALAVLVERHGVEDVTLITQDAVLDSFNQIFTALTMALAGIAAVSLAVAGIGIMNVMLVSVSERTPEVGLIMALGARRGQIVALFLSEAALISGVGGLLGLAAGWTASRLLQTVLPDLPAAPPLWAVVSALTVAVAVGLLFGAMPARRAAGLDPVDALMHRRV